MRRHVSQQRRPPVSVRLAKPSLRRQRAPTRGCVPPGGRPCSRRAVRVGLAEAKRIRASRLHVVHVARASLDLPQPAGERLNRGRLVPATDASKAVGADTGRRDSVGPGSVTHHQRRTRRPPLTSLQSSPASVLVNVHVQRPARMAGRRAHGGHQLVTRPPLPAPDQRGVRASWRRVRRTHRSRHDLRLASGAPEGVLVGSCAALYVLWRQIALVEGGIDA